MRYHKREREDEEISRLLLAATPPRRNRLLHLKLLSLRQAAKSLGLSPLTLKTAAANGDVPAVQLNGRLRFEQTALATWAFGTRRTARTEPTSKVGRPSSPAKEKNHDRP
jgi:hypothetical protein